MEDLRHQEVVARADLFWSECYQLGLLKGSQYTASKNMSHSKRIVKALRLTKACEGIIQDADLEFGKVEPGHVYPPFLISPWCLNDEERFYTFGFAANGLSDFTAKAFGLMP